MASTTNVTCQQLAERVSLRYRTAKGAVLAHRDVRGERQQAEPGRGCPQPSLRKQRTRIG
eukprot:1558178-Rhodomonas_salina.1